MRETDRRYRESLVIIERDNAQPPRPRIDTHCIPCKYVIDLSAAGYAFRFENFSYEPDALPAVIYVRSTVLRSYPPITLLMCQYVQRRFGGGGLL